MPGNPFTDPNWAPGLADQVERVVGTVRTTLTDRAVTAVRAVVFGLVAGLVGIAAFALLLIVLTKLFQAIISPFPFVDRNSSVWVSYAALGVILMVGGFWAMRKRHDGGAA